ncbi:MAG: TIGR00269 family protein [Methanomassiliicoccales archaeon]|nr:MAG: TIGR00269 family protein [Methanomassiliicoccales archaeon]
MKSCSKCQKEAVTFIRYSGMHLCKFHLIEFFEKRVKKEMRKQSRLGKNEVVALAVSGGKDSIVMMHILQDILGKRKDLEFQAITVDEGIGGYRPGSIKYAAKNCQALGIEQHIISFQDIVNITMDEITKLPIKTTPCSYCGVFRRKALNVKAKELGATKLATGLNLDDTAQSILMNLLRGDVAKLARLGPHSRVQEGLVPRIQPLRLIPEKESYLYGMLKDIEFYDGECPYSNRALRGKYRDIINDLEKDTPGTRHALLQSYDSIADALMKSFPPAKLLKCQQCGEPTLNTVCKSCSMVKDLKGMRNK